MNELSPLVGCAFLFCFSTAFFVAGCIGTINGLKGLREFFTQRARGDESKAHILFEFLVLLASIFIFPGLILGSLYTIPWSLYTMTKQVEPFGFLVAISLFLLLLVSIWQNVKKK